MKTMIYKGDRILWFFLAVIFLMFAVKLANAQPGSKDILKVKITGNGFSDETFIRYIQGASTGFESDKDAWKMFSMNLDVPMIYTKVDGYAISLNTFPALDKKVKMELFTKIKTAGNYSLETKIVSPFSDSVKIFLIDKVLNEIYNIRTDSILNVNLSADSGNTARFQLYFSTPARYSVKNLTCFKNTDGQITIENLSDMGWQMNIIDENDIFQKSVAGLSESYTVSGLHGGNYYVNIQDFSGAENFEIEVEQPFPVISSFEISSETVCICNGGTVNFYNNSIGSINFAWEYGNGDKSTEFQKEYSYSQPGEYIVSLAVSDGECSDISFKAVKVVESDPLSINEVGVKEEGTLYFDGENYIFKTEFTPQNFTIEVSNLLGQKIHPVIYHNLSENEIRINLPGKKDQLYIFNIITKDSSFVKLIY